MSESTFQVRDQDGRLYLFDEQGNPVSTEVARQIISELMNAYPGSGHVYIAEKLEDNHLIYKIGMTGQEPQKRLNQLRFDESDPNIEILHTIRCATINQARETERWLHKYFALQNARGEWFELSNSDLEWLCSYDAPPLDPTALNTNVDISRWGEFPFSYVAHRHYAEVFDAAGNLMGIAANIEAAQMMVEAARVLDSGMWRAVMPHIVAVEELPLPNSIRPETAFHEALTLSMNVRYSPSGQQLARIMDYVEGRCESLEAEDKAFLERLHTLVNHAADVMQKGSAQ